MYDFQANLLHYIFRVQADKVLLVVEAVLEALNNAESAQDRAKAAREDADSKVEQAAGLLAQVSLTQ